MLLCFSDVHLGLPACQIDVFLKFLDEIDETVESIVILGDLIDNLNSGRFKKKHWKALSKLRVLSDSKRIIYVSGNHDYEASGIAHMIGAEFVDFFVYNEIFFWHGDKPDKFITKHPILTAIADWFYGWLQRLDCWHFLAKLAKRGSKAYLHCADEVKLGTVAMAKKHGCNIGIAGHVHSPEARIDYYNTGSFSEIPCSYITIQANMIKLHYIKQ